MPRPKKSAAPAGAVAPPASPARPVKMADHLYRKLTIIATFRNQDNKEYLDELVAPLIEKDFAEVIERAAKGLRDPSSLNLPERP